MPPSLSNDHSKQAYGDSWRVALSPLRHRSQWEQRAVKDVAMNSSLAIFILLLLVWGEGAEVNLPCFSWKTLVLQNVLANNLHFVDKKPEFHECESYNTWEK